VQGRAGLFKHQSLCPQSFPQSDPFLISEFGFKGLIATGSISGRLDEMLDKLVALVTEQLEFTLQAFNNVFQRIVAFSVAMSIVETIAVCTLL
jgi:type II secretory pathway component PulF